MTFRDIERVLRVLLPAGAHRAQWWANGSACDSRHVQSQSWMKAGYGAFLVGEEQILFKRVVG
jgi:hypothetical protein